VKHNGTTVETQQLRYRRAQEALQWDAAGNLTNDAVLAFTYDAADRLIEIKDKTAPPTRTELRYEHQGRWVRTSWPRYAEVHPSHLALRTSHFALRTSLQSPGVIVHMPFGALVVPVPIVSVVFRVVTWPSWKR
jgi:YD repeat-containing protein